MQPCLVDVHQMGAGLPARDHPGVARNAGNAIEHRLDLQRQRDHARAGLGLPQPQHARATVHVVPLQRQDLVAPAPGQHQQADRRNGRGPQRAVRFPLVHEPAQPAVLAGRQIAFVLLARLVHAHRPARVAAGRRQPPRLGKFEQSREHAHRRVGPGRRGAKFVVQRRDLRAVHRADGKFAEFRQDAGVEDAPVALQGRCPAVHRHMTLQVPLGQTGHGEFGRRHRLQALFDAVDDDRRLLPGLLGGNLAVAADAHPLRPSRPAGLHDVDLSPRGVDPHPEAGKIAVPEDRVLVHHGERVDGAFGESRHIFPRHAALLPAICPRRAVAVAGIPTARRFRRSR